MKKKVLATLMAMFMTIGMVGCGSTPAASSDEPSRSSEATPPSSETESSVESEVEDSTELLEAEDGTEVEDEEVIADDSEEQEGGDRVGVRPGADEGLDVGATTQDNSAVSGLIIMTATAPLNAGTCEVISFNPESGDTQVLSNFQFKNSSDVSYLWSDSASGGFYQFDDSYTRMATRKFLSASGDEHAGWLTTDGEFFDVTEAIGAARQSDFADPVHYSSMGFTDNGLFVFQVVDHNNRSAINYYSVPISNVSAETVHECQTVAYSNFTIGSYDEYYDLFWSYGTPSSWIDSAHCILTPKRSLPGNPVTSVIFDVESQTSTEYIPGGSRNNWNGQISPDGTQIAFVSAPRNGTEAPDIFIVPISGGDPVRVAKHDFVMEGVNSNFGMSTYNSCTILVDWR